MEGRIQTGILGLDDLIAGGLPPRGTYAVVGDSGTGKSILSLAYLVHGATEFDQPGVYVMIEEDKDRMMSNMSDFGWDLSRLESENLLRIVPYSRSIMADIEATFEKEIMPGTRAVSDILMEYLTVDSLCKDIASEVAAINAKRVVIDSMTVINLFADSALNARMQIMYLINKLRKLDVTSLIIVEEGIGFWKDITFLADGVIKLIMRDKNGLFERGLLVEKMRGTDHDTGVRSLRIGQGSGIKVYPNELVSSLAKD